MQRVYTNKRLVFLTIILIVSNLLITGISLSVIYKKAISTKEKALIDVIERQKSLINTLYNEGKNDTDVLVFLNKIREKYYSIGEKGEFVICQQIGDSVIFLFSESKQTNFNINNPKRKGLPTYLSLEGKSGSIIATGYNGIKVMAAYTYVPALKWGLIARIPISEINYPYYLAMSIALLISILLISFCVFLFIRISNPIIKAVYESEKLYRELFENMLNGFSYCKILYTQNEYKDFLYLSVNKAFEDLTGLKNVIGKKATEVLPGIQNSDKELLEMYERVAMTGKSEVFERYIEVLQMWMHISVYSPEKGYFIVVFDVITERIIAEKQLKEKNNRIEIQNHEYEQINEELNQTIVELNQSSKELLIAKERAEQSDRLKTAFLQNMSHEIRTPMNAIMGFSSLLVENFNNKANLEYYTKIINQRSADLLDIINEILDLSKMESGYLSVKIEECKLFSLFSEISLIFNEYQKSRGKEHIEFNLMLQDEMNDTVILTDKVKLKQILINLITNAFKFTINGTIELGCKIDDNQHLQFYVSDSGVGIPFDKLDFIFERFTQLEQIPSHLTGGTGLGLSIVKGLVKMLNGEIWVESQLNKGSTFYFSFPCEVLNVMPEENQLFSSTQKKEKL